jgi:hypothetical protein
VSGTITMTVRCGHINRSDYQWTATATDDLILFALCLHCREVAASNGLHLEHWPLP